MNNNHIDLDAYASPKLPEAIGISDTFIEFQERLSQIAKVDRPVLIIGERGTGKELAASRLHYLSSRWQGPLVALNCAALSESVLESELFGHEQGAFTGAAKQRKGRFEMAESGTLFLDEVGLTSITVQEKILRAVEYQSFERLGGSKPVEVDVRIIGATNADLPAMAAAGKFKDDLLDRLSFEVLYLPPLRQRSEDVLYLAGHFATQMSRELGFDAPVTFSKSAERSLETYQWPGNIRELKNVVERSVYRSRSGIVREVEFNPFKNPYSKPGPTEQQPAKNGPVAGLKRGVKSLPEAIREFEVQSLKDALIASHYNQGEAAIQLGLTYNQFRNLYRKHKERLMR